MDMPLSENDCNVLQEAIEIPYRENPNFDSEHFFDDVLGVSKNINTTPRHIVFLGECGAEQLH